MALAGGRRSSRLGDRGRRALHEGDRRLGKTMHRAAALPVHAPAIQKPSNQPLRATSPSLALSSVRYKGHLCPTIWQAWIDLAEGEGNEALQMATPLDTF